MNLITVSEAARKSGLSAALIRRAAQNGAIDGAVLMGKTWAFTREAFDEWRTNRNTKRGNPQWRKQEGGN